MKHLQSTVYSERKSVKSGLKMAMNVRDRGSFEGLRNGLGRSTYVHGKAVWEIIVYFSRGQCDRRAISLSVTSQSTGVA